jgi:four helix bundle protein
VRAIAVRVAGNNFKLPADNEVCRNSTTIDSMLFPWLARPSCSVILITRRIPRGYANLADQLRRALLSTFLGIAEASSRSGSDRLARFRCARGEASEAAAALEAIQLLRLAPQSDVERVLLLLDRLCAMLTRLAGLGHRTRETPSGS